MPDLSNEKMNSEKIEKMLESVQPEPGNRFHQRMTKVPWKLADHPVMKQKQQRYGIAISIVAILVIISVFLTTPAGNVLAQEILSFFARSEGNVKPVPTEYMTEPLPTHTPEPPYGLALVPVEVDDFVSQPPILPAPRGIHLDEAESLVGFDLFEPSKLPRDYALTKVEFDNKNKTVRMEFKSPQAGSGEFFAITQSKGLEPIEVGASAEVENIQIGNSIAQFVQGGWFTPLDSTVATWTGEGGPSILRWEAEGISVEILFMLNDSFLPAYITRDEMIDLAEVLEQCPSSNSEACDGDRVIINRLPVPPNDTDWMEAYRSVAEVEALSEFDILVPGLLPEGIPFSHVRFNANFQTAWIESGDWANDLTHISGPNLRIFQSVLTQQNETYPENYPPEAIEAVSINGYAGKLYRGSLTWPNAATGEPTPAPIWNPESGIVWVTWTTDTMNYSIRFDPGYMGGERLSPQNLLLIAESLH